MRKRPTIVDVAARSGLSKSTVARALSGASNVTDDTRERVARAADEVGYLRNHLAGGMRSGRSGIIGMIIPDIANPFWSDVARGAQDRATEMDIALLVLSSDWDRESEARHFRTLGQVRVDGAIVNPVSDGFDLQDRFGLPIVLIGSSAENFPENSSVGSDIRQGVWLGMDYLVDHGHSVPALIVGPPSRIARARFLTTVRDHCLSRDIDPAQLEIENGHYTTDGGKEAMRRLLARHRIGHLSVFAANDLMALGAIMAVREAGLRCPEDVSILGFDGIPSGAFSWPGLTTVVKPGREIGRVAVNELMGGIEDPGYHVSRHLSCRLLERESVSNLTRQRAASSAGG